MSSSYQLRFVHGALGELMSKLYQTPYGRSMVKLSLRWNCEANFMLEFAHLPERVKFVDPTPRASFDTGGKVLQQNGPCFASEGVEALREGDRIKR